MRAPPEAVAAAYQRYLQELTDAGLLIPMGVPGLYARSGVFEAVIEHFERLVTRVGEFQSAEVMRFPPVFARDHYLKTDHLENFPNLLGSLDGFTGDDHAHARLLDQKARGEDWTHDLEATDLVLIPAACYPLYPMATGTLPDGGRIVDLRSFVFRREPSADPARMQCFRQREFVRLGTPAQAQAHRDDWLARAEQMLRDLGLEARRVLANDPFFGRGARMMAATQKEQDLKYELVVPVATPERPTAVVSCNCHLNHFGRAFAIRTADGNEAHTACIGFGLERVALALFRAHGFHPGRWPAGVKQVLAL